MGFSVKVVHALSLRTPSKLASGCFFGYDGRIQFTQQLLYEMDDLFTVLFLISFFEQHVK